MKKLLLAITLTTVSSMLVNAESLDLQVLERGMPGYFRDVNHGRDLAGGVSPLLKYQDISFDLGIARSIEVGDNFKIPVAGLNYHLGDLISRRYGYLITPFIPSGALVRLSFGLWGSPSKLKIRKLEIVEADIPYGYYTGFEIKF